MFVGLGVGVGRQRFAGGIFSAYAARVAADGGVTEAGSCVDAVSTLLQSASLLLVPSGYKSAKVYAEIPTNGNGDLTFTRASTAVRTNSTGLLESMATGVPRLDYSQGSCPVVLLEPQRTNSLRNSSMVGAVAGSPGTLPTNWTILDAGLTFSVLSSGVENGLPYIDLSIAGTSNSTNARIGFESSTQIVGTTAQAWTNSIYFKKLTEAAPPLTYNLSVHENTSIGVSVLVNINPFVPTTILNRYNYSVTTSGGATVARVQPFVRFGLTNGATYNFTIRIAAPQMELGAYATTYIPTTTATVTRIADSFSRNNIFTNGLITSSGGTWFLELRNNVAMTRDVASTSLAVSTTSTDVFAGSTGIEILNNFGLSKLSIIKRISGTATSLFLTTTDTVKIAVKWNGTSADVFVNGTKQVSATAFTTTNMEFIKAFGNDVPKFIQQMALYPSPLSDTDCIALTTL